MSYYNTNPPQYNQPQYPPQGNNNNNNNNQGEAASYYDMPNNPNPQWQQQQQQQQQRYDQPQQDGERGFLGAVGGGIAGGVGGHAIGGKTGHSKLSTAFGVIAGAVAGHKIQDGVSDWKDNRDEEKERQKREEEDRKRREEEDRRRREEEERRRKDNRRSPSPRRRSPSPRRDRDSGSGVNYAGNFSGSARDVRVEAHGEYMLHASCKRRDGSYQSSSISLNKLLENDQGSFRWVGKRQGGGGKRTVTVQRGDTLRGIARQVGCEWEVLARENGLQNPDLIYPGQVLQVPGGGGCGGDVGNFGLSARNVRLVDGGRRLEGELMRDGRWVGSSIVLDERIGNDNGTLVFN
ncbi:hypothetical protein OQA88_7741 [Cercophora sp. LCS_1]